VADDREKYISILSKRMPENKLKNLLRSRAVLFLLLLAFIWLVLVSAKAFYKKRQLDKEIENLKAEIAKTEQKGQELNQLLGYFGSQDYLEKEAKDKLNLKKEGESVVMVQDTSLGTAGVTEENRGNASVAAAISAPVDENNLMKWWKFLFER
jgi:cell division protein FtsB